MNKGFLIAIEGTDGSGKHLQTQLLAKRLKQALYPVRELSFPCYNSASSALVKMYLGGELGTDPSKVNAYAASTFYAVDRFASYTADWKKDYEAGKLLLADRYAESNIVHQGSKMQPAERDDFIRWERDLEYARMGIPVPDIVIFLDVPTEISARMRAEREAKTHTTADIHERDNKYLAHCREVALDIAGQLGWLVIPCTKDGEMLPPEEINNTIFELCQPKIREFMERRNAMTEYEKYQLQWMLAHGHSLRELIDGLTEFQYGDPEDSDRISTPVADLFAQWEQDCGFGSEIWACEAEWKDAEGKEPKDGLPSK